MLTLNPLLGSQVADPASSPRMESRRPSGIVQKMIVESGTVTMRLDLNASSKKRSPAENPATLQFAAAANSFFPIIVFNHSLRAVEPGSIELRPENARALPPLLTASLGHLIIEKAPLRSRFELVVRDLRNGFAFFNVEGQHYDYDPEGQSLTITGGRLLISEEFASAPGIQEKAGASVGTISIGAAMRSIETDELVNGEPKSMLMPPLQHAIGSAASNLLAGPDVIVGQIEDVAQFDAPEGTQVGLAIGTDSCNNGDQPVDWYALPSNDHPVVPQNLYRMSGGATNDERFEQLGQSWMKHTFLAFEQVLCGSCDTTECETGTHLCPGCSDPYVSSLNGDQNSIGSRAWINPFTGNFPSGNVANDHSGHVHNAVSHRILVETSDLMPNGNPGATYFGEAAYISPHEYTWCQSHPGECNMFNNFSYRQFAVSGGPSFFSFTPATSTVRMQPAIEAWAGRGATVNPIEPDPGNDGIFFVGYKITGPTAGLWHYEYAIFNMNLDRAIQSFEVVFPVFQPSLTNVGFHAPPQHPGWAHDGTEGDGGYSSTPWSFNETSYSATWNCETFSQNQNANAIRWGTLYNFRFDSSSPPAISIGNIGFFKTGSPIAVQIQAPLWSETAPRPYPSPRARPTPVPRP
jgi:hypothetical protein